MGLHPPKRFDKIVDIDYCHIQTKLANEILVEIKKESLSLNLEPYDIINHKGFLRNVIIKHPRFSNQVMVNLVTAYKNHDALLPIVQKVQKISKNIKSIINTINSGKSDSSYGMPKDLLYGENFIVEKLGVYEFEISADSFFQTNSLQALNLYEYIKDEALLSGQEIIYDFYCGTGTISLFLSKNAQKVFGFEIVESAIIDAKKMLLEIMLKMLIFFVVTFLKC